MKTTFILLSSASLLALAGCNNSDPIFKADDLESAARLFADGGDGDRDLVEALNNGEMVTARQGTVAAIGLTYTPDPSGGPTRLVGAPTLALERREDGELTLYVNGVPKPFDEGDYDEYNDGMIYGYFTDEECNDPEIGTCENLYSWSGTLEEFKTQGGYHKIFLIQNNTFLENGENIRAYGAVGMETQDDVLTTLGTASYSGRSRIDVYPDTGFQNNGESRSRINSDVSLTANFGTGTISGVMDNFEGRDPGEDEYTAWDGAVVMKESSFSGNGFKGELAPDAAWQEGSGSTFEGTYSGAFFGPAAEEAAGAISGSGTGSSDGNFNAIGHFSTTQDE